MSYCVQCGVKLADYETECPLCKTEVINPNAGKSTSKPMFTDRVDNERHVNTRFLVLLFSTVLLIPFAVVSILDVFLSAGLAWAFYVLGAELCFWVSFVFPACFPHKKTYIYCVADTAIVSLYLLMICWLTGSFAWFLPLALPLALLAGLCTGISLYVLRLKKRGRVEKAGLFLLAASMLPVGIDIIVTHYLSGSFLPVWAWYATCPMVVLGIVLIAISRNVSTSEWIRRKLFI